MNLFQTFYKENGEILLIPTSKIGKFLGVSFPDTKSLLRVNNRHF